MSHKRDASGQLYMRNRYFDPSSGAFTQEDPIGIAGGLNWAAVGWVFIAPGTACLAIAATMIRRSRSFRVDLKHGESLLSGASPFWQVNVLNPENYADGAGRRFHRRIVIASLGQLLSWITAMYIFLFGAQ